VLAVEVQNRENRSLLGERSGELTGARNLVVVAVLVLAAEFQKYRGGVLIRKAIAHLAGPWGIMP